MRFAPQDYLDAAKERVEDACRLHGAQRYPAAIYLAGVAVESLLHAYRTRQDLSFLARHDLPGLLKESAIAEFLRPADRRRLDVAMSTIWARWKNSYRYASAYKARSEYRRLKLDRGIKGDFLKENSRKTVDDALVIVSIGVRRWHSQKS